MATNFPYYPTYDSNRNPGVYGFSRPSYVEPVIGIKGRPVSSIEEARAAGIDFDGSIFYFPDIANKRIYTKQINMDGTATLNVYEYKNIPTEPVINSTQYVTREEFETTLKELKGLLKKEPEAIVVSAPAQAQTPAPAPVPQFEF